jgi:hypothetical protein
MRYIAYRQFVRAVYTYLGERIIVPLPSCIYMKIREKFSESSGLYTGFLDA